MAKLGPASGSAGPFSCSDAGAAPQQFWVVGKLSSTGAIVTEHKFKIGRLVLFHPKGKRLLDAARGTYHVIRRMPPAEDGEFQYEIRSEREGHNRVAKESELTSA